MTIVIYKMLAIISISLAILIQSACAIEVTGSSDGAGFSLSMNPDLHDSVKMNVVLGQESISSTLDGTGDIKESHWVANRKGALARVGVNISGADSYSYRYTLTPKAGLSTASVVEASESLDVTYADGIEAYAQARNGMGYSVNTGVDIFQGFLEGYSNNALASDYVAEVSQGFSRAEGDAIQLVSTTGRWTIPPGNKPPLWPSVLLADETPPEASIITDADGIVTGYQDKAARSADLSEIRQFGHIEGSFRTNATAGSETIERTSNYGSIYDLDAQAWINGGVPGVYGKLGYYVDDDDLNANKIQGAVDASLSGDIINVAAGSYNENVVIGKSLQLIGAGIEATTVDGGGVGRVFTINPDTEVKLEQMTIQNGKMKYGGGIRNDGTLTLDQILVTNNHADDPWGMGGGIYNSGDLTLSHVSITKNQAKPANWRYSAGGGGIFNSGTLNMDQDSSITYNIANYGGGIYNLGTVSKTATVNMGQGSTIAGNTATGTNGGGGIYNEYNGIVNMDQGSSITGNKASSSGWQYGGGGIYNGLRCTVNLNGGSITNNIANYYGGGIYNKGSLYDTTTVNMNDGFITGNTATYNGGGIYNYFGYGTLNLNGGSITGNTPDQIYDPP